MAMSLLAVATCQSYGRGSEHGNELVDKAKPHFENAMEEGVNHGNELVRSVKPHAKNAIDQGIHTSAMPSLFFKIAGRSENGDAHRGKEISQTCVGKKGADIFSPTSALYFYSMLCRSNKIVCERRFNFAVI